MERDSLLWQLSLAFSLFKTAVEGLTDAEALRLPAKGAWSVRKDRTGRWIADWSDVEPDPAPPTTVAWLLWHIGWWWSDVTGRAFGPGPVWRTDAPWPGTVEASVSHIADCHQRWRAGVEAARDVDFASVELGDRCWPVAGHPFAHVVAWVNGELMKNAAEIGATLRMLRAR